jgi:PST family polysaccharide transporter
MPLQQISTTMLRVVLPVLSRVHDDPPVFMRYISSAQLVGSHVLGTAFAVAAGLAVPIVAVLFGPQWSGVAPIFAVLAVGGVFRALMSVPFWIYLSHGRTGAQLRMTISTHTVIVLLLVAGLYWGPVGVAFGHSIGYLVAWVYSLWHVHRTLGLPTIQLFRSAARAMLLLSAPAGVLAYVGTLLVEGAGWELLTGLGLALGWLALAFAISPAERQVGLRIIGLGRMMISGRRVPMSA